MRDGDARHQLGEIEEVALVLRQVGDLRLRDVLRHFRSARLGQRGGADGDALQVGGIGGGRSRSRNRVEVQGKRLAYMYGHGLTRIAAVAAGHDVVAAWSQADQGVVAVGGDLRFVDEAGRGIGGDDVGRYLPLRRRDMAAQGCRAVLGVDDAR